MFAKWMPVFKKVNVINVLMLSYLKYLVKSGLNGQNSCT
ncbi:hypothetical protein AB73_4008 [Escherichia coli 3-020-07_S1_C3]|nr:hypothetical protein EC180050_1107 [Escherichia coli 180050]KDZ20566.1 hypothetical protein AB15_4125 [Escherichia coli 3-020-07_S1_C1]KDZ30554.1 hypothetical protein AB73_4008 [Escherichia coli 3-020-07_S1_C3]KEL57208.1 hypothetical protein AB66_4074 [Escherichia coli 5-172-05_S1_C3]